MSVIIFLVVLFLLVLVHEWGHFIVAKLTGMRVDEFGIGFPPKLFGIKRGETEYTVNALPIGGFVKIYGEDGTDETTTNSTDRERAFGSRSKWAQAAVLLAGVTMNVIFAWFLFTFAFTIGVQTAVTDAEATAAAKLMITNTIPDGPAADAGLPIGATITSLSAGETTLTTLTPTAFTEFIGRVGAVPVTVSYTIGDEVNTITVTPETGLVVDDPERHIIGVSLSLIDTIAKPLHVAAVDAVSYTLSSLATVTTGLMSFLADAFQFEADLSQVTGPVGIVGLVGEASAFGFASLLMFTAFISLNLAVINALPFPALDGGRLIFVIIEAIKGSPIPAKFAATLNIAGFALLMLLMIVVTWSDIAKLI